MHGTHKFSLLSHLLFLVSIGVLVPLYDSTQHNVKGEYQRSTKVLLSALYSHYSGDEETKNTKDDCDLLQITQLMDQVITFLRGKGGEKHLF